MPQRSSEAAKVQTSRKETVTKPTKKNKKLASVFVDGKKIAMLMHQTHRETPVVNPGFLVPESVREDAVIGLKTTYGTLIHPIDRFGNCPVKEGERYHTTRITCEVFSATMGLTGKGKQPKIIFINEKGKKQALSSGSGYSAFMTYLMHEIRKGGKKGNIVEVAAAWRQLDEETRREWNENASKQYSEELAMAVEQGVEAAKDLMARRAIKKEKEERRSSAAGKPTDVDDGEEEDEAQSQPAVVAVQAQPKKASKKDKQQAVEAEEETEVVPAPKSKKTARSEEHAEEAPANPQAAKSKAKPITILPKPKNTPPNPQESPRQPTRDATSPKKGAAPTDSKKQRKENK